jgi:hypothetical protein
VVSNSYLIDEVIKNIELKSATRVVNTIIINIFLPFALNIALIANSIK